ncbi:MAG: glutamate--tRNA ligase [Campylobacterota bacterium]|nr:glutamate--tRNA ligase [Campylobacterota bacterium]
MLRFAPSPTGDMHIGDLRVALLNYIVSKQRNEDFIVRIEDTDKEKNIEGKDNEILDILGVFGIEYSQVIHQSQNIRFHTAMALQLIHEKKAFSCFCSDNWLENKRNEAKEANKPYSYDDACRDLHPELVIDNTSPFSIRIKRPDETLTINDLIKGDVCFYSDMIDSFVIMNQDKTPTYNFSCAVDDMLNDISIVIRDEKHINNTPKQEHIRNSLDYDKKVEYAHIPAVIDTKEGTSIKGLLEAGYLPQAIANYLIAIGNETPQEVFKIENAVEWFDLSKFSKSSIRFDIDALKHINVEHLKAMDAKELSRYVGFADEEIGELARIYLEEVGTTKELKSKIAPIFSQRDIPQEFKEQTAVMVETIKSAPYFDKYDDFKAYIIKESGLEGEEFLRALRLLLTNAEVGPDIAEIYKYLKNYIGEIVK